MDSTSGTVFLACYRAFSDEVPIRRSSKDDKEFHFQNWVAERIAEAGFSVLPTKRNSYPDFSLCEYPEGYEVKGLTHPGRQADFDCNSQVAGGYHSGRTIYYVFGRYPKRVSGNEYQVEDMVVCHGDFLNAERNYLHKNDSFRGFGSYGDVLVRDRKMYVAPTPYALTEGTVGEFTLIAPSGSRLGQNSELFQVGELERVESDRVVVHYSFDLQKNVLATGDADNPTAGTVHRFTAYRPKGASDKEVKMKKSQVPAQLAWSEVSDFQDS
ncbi:hypothetical protein BGK72_19385 [Streptomyces agglomeratus]|nr:hypothetical protein BGK72_39165 [Streptomyces agglomeratus]OEJ55812.1 hypothetical protein BGK72_19385 [Streptomyces agglomeratus]